MASQQIWPAIEQHKHTQSGMVRGLDCMAAGAMLAVVPD